MIRHLRAMWANLRSAPLVTDAPATDTGETLTQPLPHDDATALVAATTGRNVHVQAVTR